MIFFRFLLPTIRVVASPIELIQSNGHRLTRKPLIEIVSSTDYALLSSITHQQQTRFLHFPDRQLLEYDCGKLQLLAKLLVDLERNRHRCLIYTQLFDMLNLLERFLHAHGYSYLRLDGTIDRLQQQIVVERFNNDKTIFLLILSTRTGRLSVNLTGADTIIFYDSDWHSIIHRHVRDQCERIGLTKDVHIYRLVSNDTIEEKMLNSIKWKDFFSDDNKNKEYSEEEFEQVLVHSEDQIDRQAALELIRDIQEFNTEDWDDREQTNRMEEELQAFDNQVCFDSFPVERLSFSCLI